MLFDVNTTNGRLAAFIVPSSGIVTWKASSTSSSSASVSTSTRSTSSMRSTTGSGARIASSRGRVSRNSSEKMSWLMVSQSWSTSDWMRSSCFL